MSHVDERPISYHNAYQKPIWKCSIEILTPTIFTWWCFQANKGEIAVRESSGYQLRSLSLIEWGHSSPKSRSRIASRQLTVDGTGHCTAEATACSISSWSVNQCYGSISHSDISWWRHDTETLSAILALCEGNPPVAAYKKGPVLWSFDIFLVSGQPE